ncbi:hypothetical protein [Winogradskyella forsetii]|uniref:hypothetical protein n=1 Tax=Winogradskyella forsetii TaxID=2686077 RepID=UPI0015B899E5|nr:hypothetical protein [Winogradskyella forsetii]
MKKLILILALFIGLFTQAQQVAIERNSNIEIYNDYPKTFVDANGRTILNYRKSSALKKYEDGFRDVVQPTYDSATQVRDSIYFDTPNDVFTYAVIDLTDAQIQAVLIANNEAVKQQLIQQKVNAEIEAEAQTVTDEEALEQKELYPYWSGESVSYGLGFKVLDFTADNELALYKVVQAHTSQINWKPKDVPALFTRVQLDVVLDWVQPTGAQDAYNIGDQVIYPSGSGTVWESNVDANVFAPGVVANQWTQI